MILKYKSDGNSFHPLEGFNGFPKQPYLRISSLTSPPRVRHTWPLFSSESMLNSSHLQVLALTVPSTWNAFFLTPHKLKLSSHSRQKEFLCFFSLNFSPFLVSSRVPYLILPHHFSQFVIYFLPVVFSHYTFNSQKSSPLLPHTPCTPRDGGFLGTVCSISHSVKYLISLRCLQNECVKQSIKI